MADDAGDAPAALSAPVVPADAEVAATPACLPPLARAAVEPRDVRAARFLVPPVFQHGSILGGSSPSTLEALRGAIERLVDEHKLPAMHVGSARDEYDGQLEEACKDVALPALNRVADVLIAADGDAAVLHAPLAELHHSFSGGLVVRHVKTLTSRPGVPMHGERHAPDESLAGRYLRAPLAMVSPSGEAFAAELVLALPGDAPSTSTLQLPASMLNSCLVRALVVVSTLLDAPHDDDDALDRLVIGALASLPAEPFDAAAYYQSGARLDRPDGKASVPAAVLPAFVRALDALLRRVVTARGCPSDALLFTVAVHDYGQKHVLRSRATLRLSDLLRSPTDVMRHARAPPRVPAMRAPRRDDDDAAAAAPGVLDDDAPADAPAAPASPPRALPPFMCRAAPSELFTDDAPDRLRSLIDEVLVGFERRHGIRVDRAHDRARIDIALQLYVQTGDGSEAALCGWSAATLAALVDELVPHAKARMFRVAAAVSMGTIRIVPPAARGRMTVDGSVDVRGASVVKAYGRGPREFARTAGALSRGRLSADECDVAGSSHSAMVKRLGALRDLSAAGRDTFASQALDVRAVA
ncbi:MAG: hypothetical protein AB7O84_24780 [Planctomycetota bacterium]